MYLDSTDLELTWDELDQVIGLRFDGVEVDRGTEILSAKVYFTAVRSDHTPTNLRIFAIDDTNPSTFAPFAHNITCRKRVETNVEWKPGNWERNEKYYTPECKDLVQKIINHPNWKSKNSIGFVIEGEGSRTAASFDGCMHDAPYLRIQYRMKSTTKLQ
jgi:hypothetical protein